MTLDLVTISKYLIVIEELITEVRFLNETEVGLFRCLWLGFLFVLLFAFIMNPDEDIMNK